MLHERRCRGRECVKECGGYLCFTSREHLNGSKTEILENEEALKRNARTGQSPPMRHYVRLW